MKPTIILKGIDVDPSLREQITETIDHSLSHANQKIDFITVRVTDLNGPRGGIDKRCQIHLKLSGLPNIVVSEISASVYRAIDSATQTMERVVERTLERANAIRPANIPVLRRIAI